MKHILLSCLLLLALCATALAAPVEKQTFRVVAPEGWTVTAVPDVSEGVVLVAPDKSVSVTIVTAASGTMTPEQLAADYEQKLHAARVAQNGNYYEDFSKIKYIWIKSVQPIHEEDIMANTENCPKVGIVMGSDSDMPVMAKAADILEELGIPYEMTVISAHREPDVFFEYAKSAEEKGFKVIIAGAGMAAHLPGMCAAIFPMPVIGIPMHTTSLGGRDSLYSIVQMPSGIPVATVAINGGANAGLLAAKILATSDAELLGKLKAYSTKLKEQVEAKDAKLQEIGYKAYLEGMKK